jgi:hypothetical protein
MQEPAKENNGFVLSGDFLSKFILLILLLVPFVLDFMNLMPEIVINNFRAGKEIVFALPF